MSVVNLTAPCHNNNDNDNNKVQGSVSCPGLQKVENKERQYDFLSRRRQKHS